MTDEFLLLLFAMTVIALVAISVAIREERIWSVDRKHDRAVARGATSAGRDACVRGVEVVGPAARIPTFGLLAAPPMGTSLRGGRKATGTGVRAPVPPLCTQESELLIMPDIQIECVECKNEFTWTERDQDFFKERNFSKPKRCKRCREAKKESKKSYGKR